MIYQTIIMPIIMLYTSSDQRSTLSRKKLLLLALLVYTYLLIVLSWQPYQAKLSWKFVIWSHFLKRYRFLDRFYKHDVVQWPKATDSIKPIVSQLLCLQTKSHGGTLWNTIWNRKANWKLLRHDDRQFWYCSMLIPSKRKSVKTKLSYKMRTKLTKI